ncbi:hypothetical protein EV126DRAFT_87222 [Verticillium dahliae]|nr:hypothetical protein EV126DRAFT_87222 [Verticillium dahliae]
MGVRAFSLEFRSRQTRTPSHFRVFSGRAPTARVQYIYECTNDSDRLLPAVDLVLAVTTKTPHALPSPQRDIQVVHLKPVPGPLHRTAFSPVLAGLLHRDWTEQPGLVPATKVTLGLMQAPCARTSNLEALGGHTRGPSRTPLSSDLNKPWWPAGSRGEKGGECLGSVSLVLRASQRPLSLVGTSGETPAGCHTSWLVATSVHRWSLDTRCIANTAFSRDPSPLFTFRVLSNTERRLGMAARRETHWRSEGRKDLT